MGTIAAHAERDPYGVAVIYGNGEFVETWSEIEQRSALGTSAVRARTAP